MSRRALALGAVVIATAACRPAQLPEPLRRAAELERRGKDREALAAYDGLLRSCRERDALPCRIAGLRAAEALERLGRRREALDRYLALRRETRDRETAARAQDRAAELLERGGRPREALRLSRGVIESFPGEVAAEDALRRLLRIQRFVLKRPDGETARILLELFRELEATALGDNLLYEAAALYRRNQRRDEALALLDRLAARYPRSPLRDDALWHAGQLCEERADWEGALLRYGRLLATRRDALLLGSYDSVFLDDAQLRIGVLLLERRNDPRGALAAFALLRDDFPTSTLRDDAELWIAEVHRRRGDRGAACQALARLLRRFPDGNQTLRARELLRTLSCGGGSAR
jgi:TolA-binding protein